MDTAFNVEKLIEDVFAPSPDEHLLIVVDLPHGEWEDHQDWFERRDMAATWHDRLQQMNLAQVSFGTYPATGANNGELPLHLTIQQEEPAWTDVLEKTDIVLAFTEFSATAPLSAFVKRSSKLRVASMPGVLKRMEETALSADYRAVAQRCAILAGALTRAVSAQLIFSTGHEVTFDLRWRRGLADDGQCRQDKDFPLINLPSGESFIVPYEGERANITSKTAGEIPVMHEGELVVFEVQKNHIEHVLGQGSAALELATWFKADPARANIAELGLGCNDHAIITGNVLEDEKAGLHWAYGRSEHLGGVTGPDAFRFPDHVIHQDIVYAKGCPIEATTLTLIQEDGSPLPILQAGEYCIPFES